MWINTVREPEVENVGAGSRCDFECIGIVRAKAATHKCKFLELTYPELFSDESSGTAERVLRLYTQGFQR